MFKVILILVFVFSFWTGYEYFFYTVAIIFMIHMYITLTFIIFNLCNTNSFNELRSNYKCLWLFSLVSCLISDYRFIELFTRSKIEVICQDKENKKRKNEKVMNFKDINNIDNNLDIYDENDATDANLKFSTSHNKIMKQKNSNAINSLSDVETINKLNGKNIEKNKKYLLVQESFINKIIITCDVLFVYLAFLIICLFIIY